MIKTGMSRWRRAGVVAALGWVAAFALSASSVATGPQSRQTIRVAGLQRKAEIIVDRWGVPHIFASSEPDAFLAQGFNAARDRLFQIDLWRRRGLGQLAEALGPSFVDQDKAARLFLYRGDMDREWRAYSSRGGRELEQIATSFVAGINAYIDYLAAHPERLPWEFKTLGYLPDKWRAEDVARIRSHGLTRNLISEVARANTACKAGVEADEIRIALQPPWKTRVPEGLDPCLPKDVLKVFTLATQQVVLPRPPGKAAAGASGPQIVSSMTEELGAAEGSNNWAIAPGKSATGRAMLANDPHRAYSVPSLRYIAHVCAPGLDIIGAGEPALPGISIGHNGTIAFGLTIFAIDQEDLYVYELNPADPSQYKYKDGWESFRVLHEEVKVKGQASVTAELTFTRHGPVIYVDREKNRAYALRSAWLEPGMSPYFGSLDYMRAKDFEGFRRSLTHWGVPTVNQVYADVKGNIGWVPCGLAPKRPNWDGLLPVPGDGRYEWAGFWRGDELPYAYNPASGFFATSNQMNLPADYPYAERKLGFEWANDSRYRRVIEVLGSHPKVSLDDSERLQNDVLSIPARRLMALLSRLSSSDPKTSAALKLLQGWDSVERADAAQPALFEVWVARHLAKAFREAIFPKATAEAIPSTDIAVLLDAMERPETRFGSDASTAIERRNDLLLSTLREAYAEMEKLQGSDAKAWQWGKLNHNFLQHPFEMALDDRMRARVDVGPIPKGGGPYTPNVSFYRTSDFRQMIGPSVRLVIDVGNWDASRAVNHPGQSGDPASPHYRDLARLWSDGDYFPLLYSRSAIERAAEKRIVLLPGRR